MYTLICYSDSPPGGGRTAPPGRCRGQPFGRTFETRTVTRTALREDLRNSDGHTDSPSGGTHELRPKLRSLYRVAHIRCHLSGRASPSRTSSCRNPDSLTALRNSFRGREIVVSIFCPRGCSSVLPKGCPSLRPSFEGPPEGLSATLSGGLSDRLPKGCPEREYILAVGRL